MRFTEAVVLRSQINDFMGQKDFSLKALFPVVTDEHFKEYTLLTPEQYKQVLKDCFDYIERNKVALPERTASVLR
jgi:hypothetical protein